MKSDKCFKKPYTKKGMRIPYRETNKTNIPEIEYESRSYFGSIKVWTKPEFIEKIEILSKVMK
jgi:hypothetical protein